MNATGLLFDVEDVVLVRPKSAVPTPVVTASEEDLTPVAGVALWGPVLDRLNVVVEADRRGVRTIGPGGYTGGQCYRALVETQLAGEDFLSDRALLADPATVELRGVNALPSTSTLCTGQPALSPLVGVVGETGDASRCGPAAARRTMGGRWAGSSTSAWRPSRGAAGTDTGSGSGSTRPATSSR